MQWGEFEAHAARLAAVGRRMLGEPGVVLVVTIRRDGTPRLSPVEPLFWEDDLWLSMGWGTRKAEDLARDARLLVHSIVTSRDGTGGEFKLRGRVSPKTPQKFTMPTQQSSLRSSVGNPSRAGFTCGVSTSATSHSSGGTTPRTTSTSRAGPTESSSSDPGRRPPASATRSPCTICSTDAAYLICRCRSAGLPDPARRSGTPDWPRRPGSS